LAIAHSRTSKPLAFVRSITGSAIGQSFTLPSVASTAVTTLVSVPTIACALTQRCFFFSSPYLWSNQRE
jgi:hypothetical protein